MREGANADSGEHKTVYIMPYRLALAPKLPNLVKKTDAAGLRRHASRMLGAIMSPEWRWNGACCIDALSCGKEQR
ncbi:uncharacterized protein SPSK_02041 [Sporothrix schenckii 1099-18]|uniref:Uncharacterized protein n=1 Tax=Sporothrix schenckii 1099-18 TaxID=1397361 RepID=A0A0F2MF76_SPOSC|nr:uncharacterized protein SPSK_02041 [Sporothrix schenckii 1099-18]KJR87475.1 hypothetical protein SPSK_02041 [Sporothrix schenckii 1099-18]